MYFEIFIKICIIILRTDVDIYLTVHFRNLNLHNSAFRAARQMFNKLIIIIISIRLVHGACA